MRYLNNFKLRRHPSVVMFVMAAVTSAINAAEPVPAPATATFAGETWQLLGYHASAGFTAVQTPVPYLRFANGQLTGHAGCAPFTGSYVLTETGLTVSKPLTVNAPAPNCPAPLLQQQEAVLADLAAVVSYRHIGQRLELRDAETQLRLSWQSFQPSPLLGNTWLLEFYHHSKQGLVYLLDKTQISLEFHPQGTLDGSDGCDHYMSGYTVAAAQLLIGPLATSRPTCSGSKEVAAQALAYAVALSSVANYQLEGRQLTLSNAQGKIVARFQAAAPLTAPAPVTAN